MPFSQAISVSQSHMTFICQKRIFHKKVARTYVKYPKVVPNKNHMVGFPLIPYEVDQESSIKNQILGSRSNSHFIIAFENQNYAQKIISALSPYYDKKNRKKNDVFKQPLHLLEDHKDVINIKDYKFAYQLAKELKGYVIDEDSDEESQENINIENEYKHKFKTLESFLSRDKKQNNQDEEENLIFCEEDRKLSLTCPSKHFQDGVSLQKIFHEKMRKRSIYENSTCLMTISFELPEALEMIISANVGIALIKKINGIMDNNDLQMTCDLIHPCQSELILQDNLFNLYEK